MLKHQIIHKLRIQQIFHINKVKTSLIFQHLKEFRDRSEAQNRMIIYRKLVYENMYDIRLSIHNDFINSAY